MKRSIIIALIAALALAFSACGGDDGSKDGATTGQPTATTPDASTAPAAPVPPPPPPPPPPAASASNGPIIGIGEQQSPMFSDKRYRSLGVKHVRLVVPYDAARRRIEVDLAAAWINAAKRTGSEPFITFGHSRAHPKKLPSVTEYTSSVRAFRRLFPEVRVYAPWNEINHNSQPTYRAPRRAAQYYNAMRAECRGCTVLAGDVLDQRGMVRYLKTYRSHLKGEPKIWGLHNYSDTNRFRSSGLRDMLAAVNGDIWLTETGGLVSFGRSFPRDEQRAARATAYAIKQARDNKRVKRIYLYNWTGSDPKARFDAGLVSPDGTTRPAFDVLRKALEE